LFGAWVWWYLGAMSGMDYLTGFMIEKSLSMDNVFVIALIFGFFAVPRAYQHRVLFWGIMGVIVLRAIMIGLGAALVSEFSWVLYLFGLFLLATGVKMLLISEKPIDLSNNVALKWMRSHLNLTNDFHGSRFGVKLPDPANGSKPAWFATPLFPALVLIEMADLVFAVDSVPAVFAITQDPFIVYTSNIFAILGLRALYFALAAIIHRFKYLKYGLALVLIFIGKIPAYVSLSVTFGLILAACWSRWRKPAQSPRNDQGFATDRCLCPTSGVNPAEPVRSGGVQPNSPQNNQKVIHAQAIKHIAPSRHLRSRHLPYRHHNRGRYRRQRAGPNHSTLCTGVRGRRGMAAEK